MSAIGSSYIATKTPDACSDSKSLGTRIPGNTTERNTKTTQINIPIVERRHCRGQHGGKHKPVRNIESTTGSRNSRHQKIVIG